MALHGFESEQRPRVERNGRLSPVSLRSRTRGLGIQAGAPASVQLRFAPRTRNAAVAGDASAIPVGPIALTENVWRPGFSGLP